LKNVDPLYVDAPSGDYHLKSIHGHYTINEFVTDSESSPCIFDDYELGCYKDTEEHSMYQPSGTINTPHEAPAVVITRKDEAELKAFVKVLLAKGYIESEDSLKYLNVSEGFEGKILQSLESLR
jgi:hypothetical protein